nr:reverse transcriptase domain-containing protein [Tanacetum cinerariifolium]
MLTNLTMQKQSPLGSGSLFSNTVANPRGDLKAVTTQSGVAYDGHTVPPTPSPLLKEVKRETEAKKDKVQDISSKCTTHVQTPVVKDLIPNPEVALKPNTKPSIPYPSRLNDQKLREIANNKILTSTLLNENCLAVLLKKLPKKLGEPDKFLILYDFLKLEECLALADLGASINLMPLFIWKKLSLPELTSTRNAFELANRSVSYPLGVTEDVFVKVGKFYFSTDFGVVNYDVDPRVPLILGRPFLRMARALIDVHGEELTLRVNDEAITFKFWHTSRYSFVDYVVDPRVPLILRIPFLGTERALIDVYGEELTLHIDDESITIKVGQTLKYYYNNVESINRIDVIDVACEEYVQEVLGFSNNSKSGSPTLASDPKIASSSPSFTHFVGSDFILEEIETFLQTPDELFDLDDDYYDTEGDILYLEKLLNEDPSPNLPSVKTEDHKQVDATMTKPSIDKPLDLKLKELPSHLEYAFLEGTNKLPVIISEELKDEEKSALLKVLKSHKWAIASWVSLVHCVPTKSGNTVVENKDNGLIPTRIPIDPQDQEKTTFTCPYGTFAYRHMPFGLCNAPGTFQRCMMAIFYDMIKKMMEVFMDDFSVFDAKPRLIRWILLLQEFDAIIRNKKRAENLAADHLSRLENPHQDELENKEITKTFPLDALGPFPYSKGNKYMIVAVVYLFKWVEAKALPTNDARVVVKILKSLLARFETPRAIKSDRGTHFCNEKFAKVILKYGATHRLSTVYHPQTSGQVEVSNRSLKRILERTIAENRVSWSDKLDDALWDFRTAFKTPIGCTPYKLVYEKACHLPIELEHKAYWALKHCNFDLKTMGDHWKVQLNELNELRDQAYENYLIYKEKIKKINDSKIKKCVFNVGD